MRKLSDVLRRICALALCLCMMAQYMPMAGFAEEGTEAVAEAAQAGFVSLKGHRSVGGMRASIYNAMPIEGVRKLTEFMADFEEKL